MMNPRIFSKVNMIFITRIQKNYNQDHLSAETPEVCFRSQNENKFSKCFSSCLWVLLSVEAFLSFSLLFFLVKWSVTVNSFWTQSHGYLGKENPHETFTQMLWEKCWFRKVFVLRLRLPWFFHHINFYSHSLMNKNTLTGNPQEQPNTNY